jgi:8-oxo-dGTP pyrophosphatase MutT (NUDIX family)
MELRDQLLAAVRLDHPFERGRETRAGRPGSDVAAAVCVLLTREADPCVLLTVRTDRVETHKGQIAFPGGARDEGDADAVVTALRETEEEMGIPRAQVQVVGRLPDLRTSTGFRVTPVVGILPGPAREQALLPNPEEIAAHFWAPLSVLRQPSTYRRESIRLGAVSYPIHVYQVGAHRVWGVTGAILKNLLDRLEQLK